MNAPEHLTSDDVIDRFREGRVIIVGGAGGTNVGDSFCRAASELGLSAELVDSSDAMAPTAFAQKLLWHFGGRRPMHLSRFSKRLVASVARDPAQILITTGAAPLTRRALAELKALGVTCVNFSTDDPFNPIHHARWHVRSLPAYDIVFTPRRANIGDFAGLKCSNVCYLPFGYDPLLFKPVTVDSAARSRQTQVLFVGGADRDRAAFFDAAGAAGLEPTLVGSYWERFQVKRGARLGQRSASELCQLTAEAAVNLCLVRRANRDGHVMRSFEIPAVGGFMIAEDTLEHREIFGAEGSCVLYFTTPQQAAEKTNWALVNPAERHRMAAAANRHILLGKNTYRDRLLQILTPIAAIVPRQTERPA